MSHDSHYDRAVIHHDPKEGFDPTEPAAGRITAFVVISVITLVVVMFALRNYFASEWDASVQQNVLNVAPPELKDQRALEQWRMTHYEFTTPEKSGVRIPLEQARQAVLEDAKAGRTFYKAQASTPVPETAAPAAAPATAGEGK